MSDPLTLLAPARVTECRAAGSLSRRQRYEKILNRQSDSGIFLRTRIKRGRLLLFHIVLHFISIISLVIETRDELEMN